MFRSIDDFLIDKVFQKISNKFQILTGKTCFSLARYFWLSLAIIYCLFFYLGYERDNPISLYIIFFVFTIWIISFCLYRVSDLLKVEKEIENFELTENTVNIRRLTHFMSRIVITILWTYYLICLSIFLPENIIDTVIGFSLSISWVCSIYFEACTPLPPCKSKVKECIKGFFKIKILSPAKVSSN